MVFWKILGAIYTFGSLLIFITIVVATPLSSPGAGNDFSPMPLLALLHEICLHGARESGVFLLHSLQFIKRMHNLVDEVVRAVLKFNITVMQFYSCMILSTPIDQGSQ